MGGYQRRSDDWNFQAESAAKELEQMDQQILGAQIRLEMANKELSNHLKQLDDAQAVDDFMRNKFTNQELYSWMSNQVAATYFQSYQVAYDLARKVDACYKNELPISTRYPAGGFISFGYWDSLRKGLLAGENLQMDLRRMEAAYLEDNVRELELTKNISLAINDPKSLMDLITNGSSTIYLPEELFDLDYPGHYLRRIKTISISIPCIAGPYTTIPATLTLKKSYTRFDDNDSSAAPTEDPIASQTQRIATSSAQNDSGVFELNFRDERYLPFEGKGAISEWELSMVEPPDSSTPNATQVRTFDFNTISDVIIHLRYTARASDDAGFKKGRIIDFNTLLKNPSGNNGVPNKLILPRYFSLKHEFSNEWYAYQSQVQNDPNATLNVKLTRDMFPFFCKDYSITLTGWYLQMAPKENPLSATVSFTAGTISGTAALANDAGANATLTPVSGTVTLTDDGLEVDFTIDIADGKTIDDLMDLYLVVNYKLS